MVFHVSADVCWFALNVLLVCVHLIDGAQLQHSYDLPRGSATTTITTIAVIGVVVRVCCYVRVFVICVCVVVVVCFCFVFCGAPLIIMIVIVYSLFSVCYFRPLFLLCHRVVHALLRVSHFFFMVLT